MIHPVHQKPIPGGALDGPSLNYHLFYGLPGSFYPAELEKAPEAPDASKFVEQLALKDSTGHACCV